MQEVTNLQKGSDLSIAVANQESDVRHVKALIIGPADSPYEYGFFEFSMRFGSDYPAKPPKVDAKTTNHGRCRFNPNIYANGKVCLSILGTWAGEKPGEEWSPAQGLESVLLSIQSLMSNTPYENEPGYENAKTDEDKRANEAYCAKIRHETIRIGVVQKLEEALGIVQYNGKKDETTAVSSITLAQSDDEYEDDEIEETRRMKEEEAKNKFEPFIDLFKRRFLWWYEHYLNTASTESSKYNDGKIFEKMPFEGGGNQMDGKFEYTDLQKRLVVLKDAINRETESWAEEGKCSTKTESIKSSNLKRQFEQLCEKIRVKNVLNFTVELEDNNPFVWNLIYFGKPNSNLDGGCFKIRIALSPRFPEEQPRVKFLTPIYHHRVSTEGDLCYHPAKLEEMADHVQKIVEAIEDESPPFDPRTIVHREATRLLWGSEADKKMYYRKMRRSAQATMEV